MRTQLLLAAAASSALLLTAPLPAVAAAPARAPRVTTLNTQVLDPFSLAVSRRGTYVADGGTLKVSRLVRGALHTIATGPKGGDVAGLDVSRDGRYLAFTTSNASHSVTNLKVYGPRGSRRTVDLAGYEKRHNPDQNVLYGIAHPSQCVKDAFAKMKDGGPVNYKGHIDSHPYAVAAAGHHWFVADAGGNDLLRVSRRGKVSTVAVLPRQPLTITAAIAKGIGLPGCAVGAVYNFESVPTDVEVGPHGWLYVSTLAGGPEDPSLGARSKVYRVNPWTHRVHQVGSGLAGATNIALRHGRIYVAEFFGGRISVLKNGRPQPVVTLPHALSVESTRSGLLAGTSAPEGPTGPQGTGSIVRIALGR